MGDQFMAAKQPEDDASGFTGDTGEQRLQGGLRLLVVDDNPDNADCYALMFRRSGVDVRTAYSGADALAIAAEFRPEAVLLDIGMPGMSGYEVARQIRAAEWGSQTVLIAVSGWSQEGDKQQAQAAGFDHHISKPVDFGKLLKVLPRA